MWVYRQNNRYWEVGYYAPDKTWVQDGVYSTQGEAAERVHWLNGGGS